MIELQKRFAEPLDSDCEPGRIPMIKITPEEIRLLSQYIYKISGIVLDDKKAYLFESRLARLLEEQACASYKELYLKAASDGTQKLERKIIDAITTGETLFFRDHSPFEMLKHKILPDLIDRRSSTVAGHARIPIRIWSAGCSTGQEVYSIAMVLKETLINLNRYQITLVGTDISDAAIAQASYGQYNKFEIERGLPLDKLNRYFQSNGSSWKIRDEIRAMVSFKKLNLMQPFEDKGTFDIVFCRNVSIYFGQEDRNRLFNKIADTLVPDGSLIVGSSESLLGICPKLQPKRHVRSVFYQMAA